MTRVAVVVAALAVAACREDAPKVANAAPVPSIPPIDAGAIDGPREQRCDEPCLFLIDTPLDQLGETYRSTCGSALLPDNVDCGKLDYWRNCIYAKHGLRFRKPKWKVYATKSWYKMRRDFSSAELSQLERDNVHELVLRARACRQNDVHVSSADHARVLAWFTDYAKGTLTVPALAILGEDIVKPTELQAALRAAKLSPAKDTWMAYHDPEPAVVAANPGRRLRDAIVDLSPTTCSEEDETCPVGPYVHFIFDERDTLTALVMTDH